MSLKKVHDKQPEKFEFTKEHRVMVRGYFKALSEEIPTKNH